MMVHGIVNSIHIFETECLIGYNLQRHVYLCGPAVYLCGPAVC